MGGLQLLFGDEGLLTSREVGSDSVGPGTWHWVLHHSAMVSQPPGWVPGLICRLLWVQHGPLLALRAARSQSQGQPCKPAGVRIQTRRCVPCHYMTSLHILYSGMTVESTTCNEYISWVFGCRCGQREGFSSSSDGFCARSQLVSHR